MSFFPSRTVAIEILGWPVRWYGIMYLCGFLLALALLPRLQRFRSIALSRDDWASLVSAGIVGVLVGGRLGYVFFYEPGYFAQSPTEVLAVWRGGMSSHGGFIGVAAALFLWCWLRKIDMRAVADLIVVPAAIGLAFGRLGNFINQELYGTVTALPWGVAFPDVAGLRHPVQLYAMAKDLLIAGLCFWHLHFQPVRPGRTAALFLILYGALRFLLEYLRHQDYPLVDFGVLLLSRGQLLTLPILLLGMLLWEWLAGTKKP